MKPHLAVQHVKCVTRQVLHCGFRHLFVCCHGKQKLVPLGIALYPLHEFFVSSCLHQQGLQPDPSAASGMLDSCLVLTQEAYPVANSAEDVSEVASEIASEVEPTKALSKAS